MMVIRERPKHKPTPTHYGIFTTMPRITALVLVALIAVVPFETRSEELRINEVQVIGSHNSYHIEPHASMLALIRQNRPRAADGIQYTHRPLAEQFGELGIRQIELDVFADPEGGHYAEPKGMQILAAQGLPLGPDPDPDGKLKQPGLKVLHFPDFDFRTTAHTFQEALQQVRDWSQQNPRHFPILILVEVKEGPLPPQYTQPLPFTKQELDRIDEEIASVFSEDELITPDSVRGSSETLREAVLEKGWPLISEARGKVMFALDNGGEVRDRYLDGHPSLKGRKLFASVDADHDAAAFMKLNNPVGGFEHIQAMVKQGFLVRTRADGDTDEARRNDSSQREKAFASGAQYVSTDYAEPDERLSDYQVRFPGGIVVRSNPVNGNGGDGELE